MKPCCTTPRQPLAIINQNLKNMYRAILILLISVFTLKIVAQERAVISDSILLSSIRSDLERTRVKDQTLRQVMKCVEEKFGRESEEYSYYWSLIQEQDSLNEKFVIRILDKYGWLSQKQVGYLANQSLWLVIQHAPIETQEKYLDLLKESVDNGGSEGWYLAFLEDRILMRNNKKQKYGSQLIQDKETGAYQLYPVEDPENLNKRRANIGLEPIEDYLKSYSNVKSD